MKIQLSIFLLFFCLSGRTQPSPSCGLEYWKNSLSPTAVNKIAATDSMLNNQHSSIQPRSPIVIPVVIHIVWHNNEDKISDQVIADQIEILNQNFNARNSDIVNVPLEFKPLIGNSGIQFCLATHDTLGQSTTGVISTHTDRPQMGLTEDLFYTERGGSTAWNTERYLNIWVTDTGPFILGFGTYPGAVSASQTGVVINSKYFGYKSNSKYGLGRVTVHEVGHYLGLKHLWDDDEICDTDDDVADTPPQLRAHSGCPAYPALSECSSSEMFMNFMDYTDDSCMLLFTEGQKERMLNAIQLFRPGLLLNKPICQPSPPAAAIGSFNIFPNPARQFIQVVFDSPPEQPVRFEVFNTSLQLVFSEEKGLEPTTQLSLSQLPTGLYFIRALGHTEKLTLIR